MNKNRGHDLRAMPTRFGSLITRAPGQPVHPTPTIAAIGTPLVVAIGAVLSLTVFAAASYAIPLAIRARQAARWRRKACDLLALTYDDGPDPLTTPAVIDLLKELDVPATFYLIGIRVLENPVIAEKLCADRFEFGTHTHLHQNAWKKGPIFEFIDARRCYATLAGKISSKAPYRPPFGKASLPTLLAMYAAGRRVDWWTQTSADNRDDLPNPVSHARYLLDHGGPVILMHCHHAEPHRREFVLALTRELVRQGRDRGRRFATVAQIREAAR